MHPHAEAFFGGSLKEALLRKSAKLIVPLEVIKELEKHVASDDSGKKLATAAGLDIIKDYTASGVIDVRSDEQDPHFADNTFLYVFTRFRTRYHLALITQDGALARDIQHLASGGRKIPQENLRVQSVAGRPTATAATHPAAF
jgi:rRNA-processing protein FCF1